MIAAAEQIGAEHGLAAMSLREVQIASRQRNKSAAQYHFGSREGLIEAVVETRMGPINEHRLRLLHELDDPPPLRALVEVLVVPLAEATLGRPDSRWARFLLQGWADPALAALVHRSFAASSFRTVRDLLHAALEDLPPPLRDRRIDQAVALTVMSLAAAEAAGSLGTPPRLDPEAQCADLVEVCCAVLTTPAPAARMTTPDLEASC
jgi:AcrR family transcriptional regulator